MIYTIKNLTNSTIALPSPVNKVLQRQKILNINEQAGAMDTSAWQSMISKGMVSVVAADDPARDNNLEVVNKAGVSSTIASTIFTENLTAQAAGGPISTITLSNHAASLIKVWLNGVMQFPPSGFLSLTDSLTVTASSPIAMGTTIIVDYNKI